MREIYNYPNPFIYQGLGVRLQHQIFAFSLHICYLSLCHVVHFGSRNLFLSYLYVWLSVSAAPLLCCLYVRNTVLRFTSYIMFPANMRLPRFTSNWWRLGMRGFEERECCSMLSSLDCPHSVRMVRHEPAWPPVHGLLRPQGPLQDPPQTPPAPAAAGDCPHKVGGSYHCASSVSYTFHLHVLSTFEFFLTTENCCSWVSFFIEDSLLHPNTIGNFNYWFQALDKPWKENL